MAVKRFGLIHELVALNNNSMELQLTEIIKKSDVHKINIPVYCISYITMLSSTKLSALTGYDGMSPFS